ncbi:MAG: type II toxin-antitoxin system VapC family toxin [Proteobacteria bacterium]|nr:type II toxin-antitoxin system VapC family toxin [Pseudomonadota bacterium]
MIVVDTNIIAYLYLPCAFTNQAEELLFADPAWAAPVLWRSEFRNILAGSLRRGQLTAQQALHLQHEAESLMAGLEFEVSSHEVLALVNASTCSAYDCEFVALAMHLETHLVTMDQLILRAFPSIARPLVGSSPA